jgi:hypothetical protein
MGGRGGAGGGGQGPRGGNTNLGDPLDAPNLIDKTTPGEAGSELGLTPDEQEHFDEGADKVRPHLPPVDSPDANPLNPGTKPGKPGVINLDGYARKYGRGAAKAYSHGVYWSLLRYAKAVLATASTVQQGAGAPAHAAVNATALAAYWYSRFTKPAK